MTKMKQNDAVVQALKNICGEQDGAFNPSPEQRAQVNQILFDGIRADKVELRANHPGHTDDKELKKYVSGLQSNWLRKSQALNGGVKYVAKNPGSRAGSNDASVKAMRLLLQSKTDPSERAEIQAFIDKRVAELKPTKTITINVADLPAELQHLAE